VGLLKRCDRTLIQFAHTLYLFTFLFASTLTPATFGADDTARIRVDHYAARIGFYDSALVYANKWGNPPKRSKSALPSFRPNSSYTLKRGSDSLKVFRLQSDNKLLLPVHLILKSKSSVVGGIRIGAVTKAQLQSQFGPPDSEDSLDLVYSNTTDRFNDVIRFRFKNNLLDSIEVTFEFD
jgi:hypothetical protein